MIPYYTKLKEDNKYCAICSKRCKKGQTVLRYLHSIGSERCIHRFCIIKYSMRMRLK